MARLDHTFMMAEALADAQRRFHAEIGSALRRGGGFTIAKRKPGRLTYSDGMVSITDFYQQRMLSAGFPMYAALRRLTARRIRVEFVEHDRGTTVRVRGSALRELRNGVQQLGSPGHWPDGSSPGHWPDRSSPGHWPDRSSPGHWPDAS